MEYTEYVEFYYITVNMCNNLPPDVAEADTSDTFKNGLDQHWEAAGFKYNPTASPSSIITGDRLLSAA